MSSITVSGEEFERDPSRVEEASREGPVFITRGGTPSFVLLSMEDYWRLANTGGSLAEALAAPDTADIDFEAPRLTITLATQDLR